jgi:hypothetical protein
VLAWDCNLVAAFQTDLTMDYIKLLMKSSGSHPRNGERDHVDVKHSDPWKIRVGNKKKCFLQKRPVTMGHEYLLVIANSSGEHERKVTN